jgi:hypothetical protein
MNLIGLPGYFSSKLKKHSFRRRSVSLYYILYNHMFTRTVRSMTIFWSINKIVKNYYFTDTWTFSFDYNVRAVPLLEVPTKTEVCF